MSFNEQVGEHVALVFPGQGSQAVGMGRALVDVSEAAHETLQEADDELGFPLSQLCFEGPSEDLDDTFNAQPALLAVSIASLRALAAHASSRGEQLAPIVMAGHSLGQFSALVAADVMDFTDALHLVRERGRLMKEAGLARPGGMAAVLGLDGERLVEICHEAESEGIINVANANCPGQTVISGEVTALELAMELAKTAGARRVARLPVSIASHSPLMEHVSRQLGTLLEQMSLREPRIPVVGNVSGLPVITSDGVRSELAHHVERPVNWTASVRAMIERGASTFLELEPGQVLSGLIKRIDRDVRTISVNTVLRDSA